MIGMVLDTSSTHLLVSIVEEGIILCTSKVNNCIQHSVRLLEEIDVSLKKAKKTLSDLDTIYVVNGPGSFTGLRIGVTVAKMMGYTRKIKVIPISSLELMATTPFKGEYIASYIDARRGYVYGAIYDRKLESILEERYISIEDFIKSFPQGKVDIVSSAPNASLVPTVILQENPLLLVPKHGREEAVNPHFLKPNYLKKTEAEEKNG